MTSRTIRFSGWTLPPPPSSNPLHLLLAFNCTELQFASSRFIPPRATPPPLPPLPPKMDACRLCASGCDTVDNSSPNGTCPKFWQRPPGSTLCSQAWSCETGTATGIRVCGAVFLALAVVYVRLIYHNCKKSFAQRVTRQTVTRQLGVTCLGALNAHAHARCDLC